MTSFRRRFLPAAPNQARVRPDIRAGRGGEAVRRGLEQALDEYLVLLAQGGSREAFGRLAARWSPRLLAFAARSAGAEAAYDVVQETWESVLRKLRSLDDPARFRAWLYAIAARKCADALRAKYRTRRGAAIAQAETMLNDAEIDPDAQTASHLDLAHALQRLPPEQRTAIALLYGEDMSVAEIAAVTGVPPGTVKSRLAAARHALRAHMQGEDA